MPLGTKSFGVWEKWMYLKVQNSLYTKLRQNLIGEEKLLKIILKVLVNMNGRDIQVGHQVFFFVYVCKICANFLEFQIWWSPLYMVSVRLKPTYLFHYSSYPKGISVYVLVIYLLMLNIGSACIHVPTTKNWGIDVIYV